jgi:predicted RNase H-like HicB family nuclease
MLTCRFTMEYWRDGSWYVGLLREVPGVFSQGKTLAELDENLRDAYRLVLKDQQPSAMISTPTPRTAAVLRSLAIPKSRIRFAK